MDEDFKLLIEGKKRCKRRIYKQIAKDIDLQREEIRNFELLD